MQDLSDDELMQRTAAGDRSSFDAIVQRHQHRLQRFASRMLDGDTDRGADVAVGTFIRLWEHRFGYQTCGQLSAWLLRTAYRLTVDLRRNRQWDELGETSGTAPDTAGQIEEAAKVRAVREAVRSLDEPLRAVLILSVYEGFSYDQISQALEIPVGTVGSRRNVAIAHLRKRLAAWEDTP